MFILKQKYWFTDTCSCMSRGYQMWKNVKWPLTDIAPRMRNTVDSSNKAPDTIIRAPKAVVPGTYIERNVRWALTCDYNAFQKNPNCKVGTIFFLLDVCLYLKYTRSYRAHIRNVACRLPSSSRQIWVAFWGHHTIWVGAYLYEHYDDAEHPWTYRWSHGDALFWLINFLLEWEVVLWENCPH